MTTMRIPLFRAATFQNIGAKSKKDATVSARITPSTKDLIYVRKIKSTNEIVGFIHPDTGLFVTKIRPHDTQSQLTHNTFRQLALTFAQDKVDEKLEELKDIETDDPELYKARYKPLKVIEQQLSEYMADQHEFFADLDRQVAVIRSNAKPAANEYVLYEDDVSIGDVIATTRLPYKNPKDGVVTEEQEKTVDKFLDVFLDDYNKLVLTWYFGAMLLNIPIYDSRVSKMMVVSSARGGSGKNTLINALSNALLTDDFREVKSSFDLFFMNNNRFGSSQLTPLRLVQYSEAEWNDVPNGLHNFDGLNISEIKSMITEGFIASEKKYEEVQMTRLSSFHIVLTNHPPVIDEDRSALNRRFLACVIKPNRMSEKGEELNMRTEQAVIKYVEDNVQAFANVCVRNFLENEHAFSGLDYNYSEMVGDINDSEAERLEKVSLENKELNDLKMHDINEAIHEIGKRRGVDVTRLLKAIWEEKRDPKEGDIRWEGNTLYLNSSKNAMVKYGPILPILPLMKQIYGAPQKKFGKRMFKIEGITND